jgi:hypothetical protein
MRFFMRVRILPGRRLGGRILVGWIINREGSVLLGIDRSLEVA